MAESSKKVKLWRQDVVTSVDGVRADLDPGYVQGVELPLAGPLEVVVFYLPRPGYHSRPGKGAGELKDSAPSYVGK